MSKSFFRRSRHVFLLAVLIVFTVAMGGAQNIVNSQAERETPSAGIVGAWTVTIHSPTNEFPDLKGTYAFLKEGVLLDSDIGQLSNPPATSGQGTWVRDGKGSYRLHVVNFSINPDGSLGGRGDITGRASLNSDGKHFTASVHFAAHDTSGNLVFEADEVVYGNRIKP
jgi:hypothetical protein